MPAMLSSPSSMASLFEGHGFGAGGGVGGGGGGGGGDSTTTSPAQGKPNGLALLKAKAKAKALEAAQQGLLPPLEQEKANSYSKHSRNSTRNIRAILPSLRRSFVLPCLSRLCPPPRSTLRHCRRHRLHRRTRVVPASASCAPWRRQRRGAT